MPLAPPLPANRLKPVCAQGEFGVVGSQLWFQTISGMYPFADSKPAPLLAFQKFAAVFPFTVSLNCVPPTAVSNGVEARPLTASPPDAGLLVGSLGSSQPAAPSSPEDTKTLMPCAAACCQRLLKNWFSCVPRSFSHCPKLTLMIGARLLSTINIADKSTPSLVRVEELTTTSMLAAGATAPDHSASRMASISSPGTGPGSWPLKTRVVLFGARPKVCRNVETSMRRKLLRATIAIVCPAPLIVFNSGLIS